MARFTGRIGLVVLWLAFSAAASWADLKVYQPQHRTAEDLLPLVQVALSEGGSVAIDAHGNALVMVGSAAEISQALEILALQDRRLRSVFIQHETRTAHDLEAAGVRIQWSAAGDVVSVGNVARGAEGTGVRLRVGEGTERASGSQTGSVRVLEGSWGRISSGSTVLVPIGSARHPGAVAVSAESGVEVRPRILSDGRVRLDLRPFQGSFGRGGVVRHSGADTSLVVTAGETAVVGQLGAVRSSRSDSLSGTRQGREESRQLLLVTVTVDGEN